MSRAGRVYVQGKYAGKIMETDEGYEFEYDSDYLNSQYAIAISLTIPLSDQKYVSNTLFPFFDGLIPEGWLLNVVERNWKIDSKDRFGLMLASCRDCIGDIEVRPEDDV